MNTVQKTEQWVSGRCRDIGDGASDTIRQDVVARALVEARSRVEQLQAEVKVANEVIEIHEEAFSGAIGALRRTPRLIATFKDKVKGLTYLIVGGAATELVLSGTLSVNLFWFWSTTTAVLLGSLLSLGCMALADGAFSSVSPDSPIRRVRRMWKTIGWLAMATGVALVPAILARIAPVSSLIAELGAGLATLALIPLVGAAASLRRSLKSYFGDHFEKRRDLMAAIAILEGQISLWKRSLADGDSHITKVA